jgi:mannose-1-phosphate guanylyltransferase
LYSKSKIYMSREIAKKTFVAIMAGGVGSRFWPSSRETRPKQFMDIMGVGKSLLRLTFERFAQIIPSENIYVVTNEAYGALVAADIPEIGENQILLEPSRNNTAPSVAYVSYKIKQKNPEGLLIVAPSDHIILKEQVFLDHIFNCLAFAEKHDSLLTLGITPTRPDTGYGYINYETEAVNGIFNVLKFEEKPNLERAELFLKKGSYLWNAGIFIWSLNSVTKAFETFVPELHRLFEIEGEEALNSVNEQAFIDANYPNTPNISIDYALLEKASNVYTMPADIGWSDLGTWASLFQELKKDDENNAIVNAHSHLINSTGNLIKSENGKLIVVSDLHDFIIIDEPNTLMIVPRDKEQEVKNITNQIKNKFGTVYS